MGCCTINKVMIAIGIVGVVLIVLGAVLGFAVIPPIIDDEIEASCRLEEGTEQYDRWEELPFPLTFKVYVFNVLNADKIITGSLPEVVEVGPYVFNQYRKKFDIEKKEGDLLEYKQHMLYEFDSDASAPLTLQDEHMVLNAPLQGVLQTAELGGSTTQQVANAGYSTAFQDGLFHTITMEKFLFGGSDGYTFCNTAWLTSLYDRMLCNTVIGKVGESATLTVDEDRVIHFSFFNHKNNSNDGIYVINAGNDDIHQLGAIQSWNNEIVLDDVWDDSVSNTSNCNVVRGRDSSIYPPFNNDSSEFDIFNTDICRIVHLKTTSTATYKDIDGNVATLGIENFQNTGDGACYCTKETLDMYGNKECLPDGFADLKSCLGSPVVATFPHLLGVPEDYQKTVASGLFPDENKHQTYVNIEPGTGSPLQGGKRMQFNMFIRPLTGIDDTKNFPNAVMPILWVEEGVQLSDKLVQKLKDDYLSKLVLVDVVTWVPIGLGIAMLVGSLGFLLYKKMS